MIKQAKSGTYIIDMKDLNIKSQSRNELRSTCPVCRLTRHNPNDPSLSVNVTNGVGKCHHCGSKFIVTDYAGNLQKDNRSASPVEETYENIDFMKGIVPFDEASKLYLETRNIDPEVARKAHMGTKIIHGIPYLAFPFMDNGKAVNVQYKRADGKEKAFLFAKGGKMLPWNIDCINDEDTHGPLYITEGMMDAVALMQSGFKYVVSVPNGAGSKMEVFDEYKERIKKKFTGIVFAGDTDEAGIKLRDKVKDYFEGIGVGTVDWKWRIHDNKDANGMLEASDTENVANCIRNATYDDEKGYSLARVNNSRLWKRFEEGAPEGIGVGIKEVDNIVQFLPGSFYVITGYPGSGKSTFVNYVTMSLLHAKGWRTLYYTPEKMPEENHLSELISVVLGKPFDKNIISNSLMTEGEEYISGNVIHIDDRINDLDKLLDIAARVIRRHQIKVFVIDPFLYLTINNLKGKSESTRITEMLVKIRHFAEAMNIVLLLVAHPRKPNTMAGPLDVTQKLYEISGSSGFVNTCDVGIVIERPDINKNTTYIGCGKSRYSYLGKVGETTINFDPACGRYTSREDVFGSSSFRPWILDRHTYGRDEISDFVSEVPF